MMPVTVVDVFERIDVDDNNGLDVVRIPKLFVIIAAVVNFGQRIGI
mgnify:FL=1